MEGEGKRWREIACNVALSGAGAIDILGRTKLPLNYQSLASTVLVGGTTKPSICKIRPQSCKAKFLKFAVVAGLERPDPGTYTMGNKLNLRYIAYLIRSSTNETRETYPVTEEPVDEKVGVNGLVEPILTEKKPAAMIHDFCFGIPFSERFCSSGGDYWFYFSRNPTALATNVLARGSLLARMTSLKVWRSGKSCIPFILGQADEYICQNWVKEPGDWPGMTSFKLFNGVVP